MANPKDPIRSYDFDVLEPFFYAPGVQQTATLKNMAQFKNYPASPNMTRQVSVPKISQAAIDDFKGGSPSPFTVKYLTKIYSQFGQGMDFEDWLENATMSFAPYSQLYK